MRLPSTNPVTLRYGATSAPYSTSNPHAGTDYAGGDKNSYAPEQVRITAVYPPTPSNDCGYQLDFTSMDGVRTYRFCHSSQILVTVGETCPEGMVLAIEGETGNAQGVHLHFVMWVNGERVDGDATIKSMLKGDDMSKEQAQELSLYLRLLAGEDVPTANSHSDDDVNHILADPGYAGALGKQLYNGEWQQLSNDASAYRQGETADATVLKPGNYKVS